MAERRRAKSEKSQAFRLFRFRRFNGFIQVKGNGNKQICVGVPRSLRGIGIQAEDDDDLLCLLFMPCILAHWHGEMQIRFAPVPSGISPKGIRSPGIAGRRFPAAECLRFPVFRLFALRFPPSVCRFAFRPPPFAYKKTEAGKPAPASCVIQVIRCGSGCPRSGS